MADKKYSFDKTKGYHTEFLTWAGRVEQTFGRNIEKLRKIITHGNILEVGSSTGETTKDLANIFGSNVQVYSIEVNRQMLIDSKERSIAERVARVLGDVTGGDERQYQTGGKDPVIFAGDGYRPPFAKNTFEAVFLMNNLYQSIQQNTLGDKQTESIMVNISNIIKPGGFLCISGTEAKGSPFVIYRFDENKNPFIFDKNIKDDKGKVFDRISNAFGVDLYAKP